MIKGFRVLLWFGIFVLILMNVRGANGDDISGQWNGKLDIQGTQLRIVFNVIKTEVGYTATMDSPDQKAFGLVVKRVTFGGERLEILMPDLGLKYVGDYRDGKFDGTFEQGGMRFSMVLSREKIEKKSLKRPQEPEPPFEYHSEELIFENRKDKVILAGTFTRPLTKNKPPVVVLISGSGAQDRNEEIMGHKPFLVLSDYLTRNGIAVLRYDDRGFGESTGDFTNSTTEDFARDVEAAVEYLKTRDDVDLNRIGLLGHSEGGLIAPMVASRDSDISFIVLLAGSGVRGDKLLLLQTRLILEASEMSKGKVDNILGLNGKIYDKIISVGDGGRVNGTSLKLELEELIRSEIEDGEAFVDLRGEDKEKYIVNTAEQSSGKWVRYFINYDPYEALTKVKCSVLALNGAKDLQVPARENLDAIRKGLEEGGNDEYVIKEYPELNHLFQESETGLPDEYGKIEQTISPVVLMDIKEWILER